MRGELKPTASGKWQIRIYLGRDKKTGKKDYYIETVEGSESDAKIRRTILLAEKHKGKLVAPLRMTVAHFFGLWESQALPSTVRKRTEDDYKAIVRRYIIPEFGDLQL